MGHTHTSTHTQTLCYSNEYHESNYIELISQWTRIFCSEKRTTPKQQNRENNYADTKTMLARRLTATSEISQGRSLLDIFRGLDADLFLHIS